jgi:outer membrane protein OmpA-like peptidoglycan-associated protein/tetratricopeptide (TPR) repeat protein
MILCKKVYFIIAFCLLFFSVAAQSTQEKKLLKKARKALSEADYDQAKVHYNQLLELNPTSQDFLFEAGLTYFNSDFEKEKSVAYFEKAMQNTQGDTIPELLYYLGKAYHYTHQFDKAIYYYNEFRKFLAESMEGHLLGAEITRLIEMCNNGIEFQANEDKNLEIKNLGVNVNSRYAEYAPVINKNESLLIFTARKSGSTGGKVFNDAKYFEDIYASVKDDTIWSSPTKFDSSGIYISSKINSKFHDAAIGYNETETKLYIYRDKDVWQSELVDGVWQEPVRMNKNINTRGHEPSVFITPDESTIFIVSTRPGGLGGRDIFVSKKLEDGTWGPAINLGETINTPADDDAPYLSADGKTLYFSSRGHNTMGGYDVYKSELQPDGTWGTPVNLGMPINSAGDDIYYLVNADNTVGFYSSSRMGGYGDMDIYRIQLECKTIPNTEVRGLVLAGEKQIPVAAKIKITDKESGELIGNYAADKFSGKYLMVLPPNKTYILEIEAEGFEAYRYHKEEFFIPKQCEFYQLFQQINIRRFFDTTVNKLAQEATFHNAMFDVKTQTLQYYGITALPEDGSFGNQQISPDYNMTIGGKILHNNIIPAKNVEIFLVNSQNEIVRTINTDRDGVFEFIHLKPGETYRILINEEDAHISYFGNPEVLSGSLTPINGIIEVTDLNSKTTIGAGMVPVMLITNEKKIINLTTTDISGKFSFGDPVAIFDKIQELNNTVVYTYNIDLNDADQLYSSFIQTIDPDNNQLFYTEYIDILYFEKMIRERPEFENIYFDFDKYFLRKRSIEILDKIAEYLTAHPDVTIEIDGHCDWFGTDAYNVKLSQRRTSSAFDYLAAKGIDRSRMKPASYGESKPAVPNANQDGTDNPDNRQLNRRVEFRVNIPDMAEFTFVF